MGMGDILFDALGDLNEYHHDPFNGIKKGGFERELIRLKNHMLVMELWCNTSGLNKNVNIKDLKEAVKFASKLNVDLAKISRDGLGTPAFPDGCFAEMSLCEAINYIANCKEEK